MLTWKNLMSTCDFFPTCMLRKTSHVNMHIHICNMHVANVNMHVDMLSPVCGHTSIYLQYEWSLMINTMQDCVAKRFIQWQLGYKVLLD